MMAEEREQFPELVLLYGDLVIGPIKKVFCNDETWHGILNITLNSSDGILAERVLNFIAFCEKWNERNLSAQPPAASEFDIYDDIVNSASWETKVMNGEKRRLDGAPVFFLNREVSWRLLNTQKSPVFNPVNLVNPVKKF